MSKFGWYPCTEELAKVAQQQVKVNSSLRPVTISLSDGQRLIAFRRNAITVKRDGSQTRKTDYYLGYQETKNGQNHKFMLKIDESGHIEESE